MFIDELTLHLKAGRGGHGVVRWLHEKGKEYGGPSGGNGGKGGDIYALAVRDIGILAAYRNQKEFEAERGQDGLNRSKQGEGGDDLVIKFPVGARIKNLESGHVVELLEEGQKELLLKGGRGGLGNEHFKGSKNVRPEESTPGEDGEEADFLIELLLVVDAGLIGLPNAGKSSLLNALTRAKSKVGAFPFTTLEPALGDLYGLVLADIPGLIRGAAEGKGLGHKFLRHVERTRTLIHCISAESEDLLDTYNSIREELALYNVYPSLSEGREEIAQKPEVIVLTKTDTIESQEVLEAKLEELKTLGQPVFPVSIINDEQLKTLADHLTKELK